MPSPSAMAVCDSARAMRRRLMRGPAKIFCSPWRSSTHHTVTTLQIYTALRSKATQVFLIFQTVNHRFSGAGALVL